MFLLSRALFRYASSFNDTALNILKKFDKFELSKYSAGVNTEVYGLDSLDTVEFIIALESELLVELTDEEALGLTSVDSAFKMFSKYKKFDN